MTWAFIFLAVLVMLASTVAISGYLVWRLIRPQPATHQPQNQGTGLRAVWIIAGGGVAALLMALFAPATRRVEAPPPPDPLGRMSPRTLQAHSASNGIAAGAAAGQKLLANTQPSGHSPIFVSTSVENRSLPLGFQPAVQIRVRSDAPHYTRERAIADAVQIAQAHLSHELQTLNPPVDYTPTAAEIRERYLRPESVVEVYPTQQLKDEWVAAKLDPNRLWVELDVVVSPEQLRELRAESRLLNAGRFGAVVFAIVLAAWGFLRIDAWTKGYLTGGLAIVAGVLVLAAVAAIAFIG